MIMNPRTSRLLPCCAALAFALPAQDLDHRPTPVDLSRPAAGTWPPERVLHDEPGDGRRWAHGANWKASFGPEGFVYVPFLAGAHDNAPMHFRLAAVRVGGEDLPVAAEVAAARDGDRLWFDRGSVRECYDVGVACIEQSFVVAAKHPGDVEVELAVTTTLHEDGERPGLQFVSPFGEVVYGDAFLRRGADRVAIPTEWRDGTIVLRVPAALRGDGPVVIDPILSTQGSSITGPYLHPDVAYDASNDCWLLVWEKVFSATDHDIFTEAFDGQGNPMPFSLAATDVSAVDYRAPRIANLNAVDRFLVVAEAADPLHGLRHMVFGRMRDAGGARAMHPGVRLSDPNIGGENVAPEVGADPGTGAGLHDWLVVWTHVTGPAETGVLGRSVDGAGVAKPPLHFLRFAGGTGEQNLNPQVSRSNGNGLVSDPKWLITYTRRVSGQAANVYALTMSPNGALGLEVPIDQATADDRYPQVSSPIEDVHGNTWFLITYERQNPLSARAALVRIEHFSHTFYSTDLTAQLGVGPYWVRCESDGIRFVVTSSFGPGPGSIAARTIGFVPGSLSAHTSAVSLSSAGQLSEPELASTWSSGGPVGVFGIGFLQPGGSGSQAMLTRYAAQSPGPMTQTVATGCNGLAIAVSGSSALGESLQFTLSGFGADLPGFAFGGPAVVPIAICPVCSLGLRLDLPILPMLGSATASLAIPPSVGLVGQQFAMQGVSVGAGTCLGGLSLSDTVVLTVR